MNLKEFDEYRLTDAIRFNRELNPDLFHDEKLDTDVRKKLLEIAEDFIEHLGVGELQIKDITLSGSNAAYTYTPHSDIDLHLVVDIDKLRCDEIYRELFTSKKILYNDTHDIKIQGYDVELYVQNSNEPVKSLGEYSVLRDKWIKFPSKRATNLDDRTTREKFAKLVQLTELALRSNNLEELDKLLYTIKKYRQVGLDKQGEFGPENLVYKILRSRGIVDKLYKHRDVLHSKNLSMQETKQESFYGAPKIHALESASGYIPSNAERNDPRFKTGLTVDVKPDSIKINAKKLGLGTIKRSGLPRLAKTSGKF